MSQNRVSVKSWGLLLWFSKVPLAFCIQMDVLDLFSQFVADDGTISSVSASSDCLFVLICMHLRGVPLRSLWSGQVQIYSFQYVHLHTSLIQYPRCIGCISEEVYNCHCEVFVPLEDRLCLCDQGKENMARKGDCFNSLPPKVLITGNGTIPSWAETYRYCTLHRQ